MTTPQAHNCQCTDQDWAKVERVMTVGGFTVRGNVEQLVCADCGREFGVSVAEQGYYVARAAYALWENNCNTPEVIAFLYRVSRRTPEMDLADVADNKVVGAELGIDPAVFDQYAWKPGQTLSNDAWALLGLSLESALERFHDSSRHKELAPSRYRSRGGVPPREIRLEDP